MVLGHLRDTTSHLHDRLAPQPNLPFSKLLQDGSREDLPRWDRWGSWRGRPGQQSRSHLDLPGLDEKLFGAPRNLGRGRSGRRAGSVWGGGEVSLDLEDFMMMIERWMMVRWVVMMKCCHLYVKPALVGIEPMSVPTGTSSAKAIVNNQHNDSDSSLVFIKI